MTLADLERIFRGEVFDTEKPYLWSFTEVLEFANDAVMEAVRRGLSIVDSTTADICHLAYTTDPVLTLDPRIIVIRSAIINGQTLPLCRVKTDQLDNLYPGWRTSTQQYPSVYIFDWGSYRIRLHPAPTLAGTVYLSVSREPLAPMVRYDDTPELPARYHRSLVHWMKYRAYSKDDTESENVPRAKKAEDAFAMEFGERKSARNEKWQEEQAYIGYEPLC